MKLYRQAALFAALLSCASAMAGFKDEMRQPWQRNDTSFIRGWKIAGAFKCDLARDCLDIPGGEAAAKPDSPQKRADGSVLEWRDDHAWADSVGFGAAAGERDGAIAYAATTVTRAAAGKAQLSIGSVDGIRVWVNGRPVLARDGRRSRTPDEDPVEVDLAAGANTLLIKSAATGSFSVRVLEPGTVLRRVAEIGPSLIEMHPEMFTVRTDVNAARAAADPVKIEVVRAGGEVAFTASAKRGELVVVDAKGWAEGPYEVRVSTHTPTRLLTVSYLPWYKGNALVLARELGLPKPPRRTRPGPGRTDADHAGQHGQQPAGREAGRSQGNPWAEASTRRSWNMPNCCWSSEAGHGGARAPTWLRAPGVARRHGQHAAVLPRLSTGELRRQPESWPLVLQLHGFNPPNPLAPGTGGVPTNRHVGQRTRNSPGTRGVIYIEPHGRGNTQYLALGDADVLRLHRRGAQAVQHRREPHLSHGRFHGWLGHVECGHASSRGCSRPSPRSSAAWTITRP